MEPTVESTLEELAVLRGKMSVWCSDQVSDGSSVSMKSDNSKGLLPPVFSAESEPGPDSHLTYSALTSSVSMKSDNSKGLLPPVFSPEPGPDSQVQNFNDHNHHLDEIFSCLEKEILAYVKRQLQKFHLRLRSEGSSQTTSESTSEGEGRSREAVLNITLDFLRRMGQEPLAERLSKGSVGVCRDDLKSHLKHKFSQVFEGVAKAGKSAPLQEIYTDLYIIQGGSSEVNQEHEVRYIECASRRTVESTIVCEDIFKQQPESEQPIRAVLTKGVAGVGKTVLTQKFTLDWAEGRANQDVQLLFPFTFRELNMHRDSEFSLMELLHNCFSQTKALCSFKDLRLLFIFDGLDECRLPLDFRGTRVLTEPIESASVEELLVNLIRGSLLPSARLWITTRPAAANQIPAECISMMTEVRGFTNRQKEQYFRKRFTDEQQTTVILSHIKSVRSLYIMSFIPIFCWILSTVLRKILEHKVEPELPKTLTQMYVHFLVVHAKVKNIKFHGGSESDLHWTPETKEMVLSLGKLAFEQLLKGNLIFYESDLSESGLDAADIARYSGVFTQIFREEQGLYQDKVYCFIHLSVQEFLAALHVHHIFFSTGENLLSPPQSSDLKVNFLSPPLSSDLKVNFLSPPQSLERLGPTTTCSSKQIPVKLTQFIQPPNSSEKLKSITANASKAATKKLRVKKKSEQMLEGATTFEQLPVDRAESESSSTLSESSFAQSPEAFYHSAVDQALKSPNGHLDLFLRFLLGLSQLTNQRLLKGLLTPAGSDRTNQETVKYIHQRLNEEGVSAERSMNLLHCLNELNDRSLMETIQRVVRGGSLSNRDMSPAQWSAMSFLLLSSDSDLEQFDLRKYCPSEEGLLGLLPVVKASTKATLRSCGLSSLSCGSLASILSSSSSLTQMDISNNDLQDSGVELLCEGLKSATCRLHTLRLSGCMISERGGALLAKTLSSASSSLSATSSCLTELDLRYNYPGASTELLIALRAPQGPLQTLRLDPAGKSFMDPGLRKYTCEISLDPNTVNRELLLSEDHRSVTRVEEEQQYPDHDDRFTDYSQVMSSTGLRGRCYWEVDWSVRVEGVADIAVTYRGIRRKGKGDEGAFGYNDQSWSLNIFNGDSFLYYNNSSTRVSVRASTDEEGTSSGRVGVFLDWEGGALSFYDVAANGELSHIHTITSTFTEDLYPGFGLNPGSSVSVVKL